jgi:hypothetical protein
MSAQDQTVFRCDGCSRFMVVDYSCLLRPAIPKGWGIVRISDKNYLACAECHSSVVAIFGKKKKVR